MQALETIERNNTEAVQRAIPAEQAKGRYVVAQYSGLNFINYQAFATESEANTFGAAFVNEAPGNRVEYHNPTK